MMAHTVWAGGRGLSFPDSQFRVLSAMAHVLYDLSVVCQLLLTLPPFLLFPSSWVYAFLENLLTVLLVELGEEIEGGTCIQSLSLCTCSKVANSLLRLGFHFPVFLFFTLVLQSCAASSPLNENFSCFLAFSVKLILNRHIFQQLVL